MVELTSGYWDLAYNIYLVEVNGSTKSLKLGQKSPAGLDSRKVENENEEIEINRPLLHLNRKMYDKDDDLTKQASNELLLFGQCIKELRELKNIWKNINASLVDQVKGQFNGKILQSNLDLLNNLRALIPSEKDEQAIRKVLLTTSTSTILEFISKLKELVSEQRELIQQRIEIADEEEIKLNDFSSMCRKLVIDVANECLNNEELPEMCEKDEDGIYLWIKEKEICDDIFNYIQDSYNKSKQYYRLIKLRGIIKFESDIAVLKNLIKLINTEIKLLTLLNSLGINKVIVSDYDYKIVTETLESEWLESLEPPCSLKMRVLLRNDVNELINEEISTLRSENL